MMNTIITIGRQYGSGGRIIGQKLAAELGVKCYDKELLDHVANESGLSREIIEHHDEKPTNSFLYSLVMDSYSYGYSVAAFNDMPMNHKIFLAQFDAIKKLADEGPCVIVGRCADYALEDRNDCMSVFIHANQEARIQRICERYNLSPKKAKDAIVKTDKGRASYYNYYTNRRWGEASGYDLCINSGFYGLDGSVDLIIKALEIYEDKIKQGASLKLQEE